MKDMTAARVDEPLIQLFWGSLAPLIEGSLKRQCPFCDEGVLVLRRGIETGELVDNDTCLLCGQQVQYVDIEDLRRGQ